MKDKGSGQNEGKRLRLTNTDHHTNDDGYLVEAVAAECRPTMVARVGDLAVRSAVTRELLDELMNKLPVVADFKSCGFGKTR